jgi:hypothetical protein
MPEVRLPFIPSGALNTANSLVVTGQYEPITGLPLPSGLTAGAYFDMTESEAQAYSNTTVGTLHAGRYQWVQLSSGAVITGNGALQRGQGLFAVPSSTLPPTYVVTNVPPAATSAPAVGVFLNTANTGTFPVTPSNWFFMQLLNAPGRATVKMAATLTGTPTGNPGDPIACKVTAAAGVDTGLFDDLQASANTYPDELPAFIGVAEAAVVASALQIVDLRNQASV